MYILDLPIRTVWSALRAAQQEHQTQDQRNDLERPLWLNDLAPLHSAWHYRCVWNANTVLHGAAC